MKSARLSKPKSVQASILLIAWAVVPEATVLRFHVEIDFPQQLGDLAEHPSSNQDDVDSGDRSHPPGRQSGVGSAAAVPREEFVDAIGDRAPAS